MKQKQNHKYAIKKRSDSNPKYFLFDLYRFFLKLIRNPEKYEKKTSGRRKVNIINGIRFLIHAGLRSLIDPLMKSLTKSLIYVIFLSTFLLFSLNLVLSKMLVIVKYYVTEELRITMLYNWNSEWFFFLNGRKMNSKLTMNKSGLSSPD